MSVDQIDELDRQIALVETNLATLKNETDALEPGHPALLRLQAIIRIAEGDLGRMRARRAQLLG